METDETRSVEVGEFSPPEDVLAEILGRLPRRDLAQSRRVCRPWRTLVDTRRLLLRHALPHSVRGIFLNYWDERRHQFVARPASAGPQIDGKLSFLPGRRRDYKFRDHRNGLVLVYSDKRESWYVANPATRRWACLPPVEEQRSSFDLYLVFEPTVSPHYEVWLVPSERWFSAWDDDLDDELMEEWPPSTCVLQVLSSKIGRWEKRAFVREGATAGTLADLKKDRDFSLCDLCQSRQSAYWKGTLYLHCRDRYITRLSLADNKYQIIKTPANIDDRCGYKYCLGNSKNGVYFAAIYDHMDTDLKVWILEESFGQEKWVLKHDINMGSTALNALSYYSNENNEHWRYVFDGAWNLEDVNDDENCSSNKEDTNTELIGENIEWNSDEDDVLSTMDEDEINSSFGCYLILGFHPYKEVIFLAPDSRRGVAYHFNTSKVQYLGTLGVMSTHKIVKSFVYTPCMIGELPESSSNVPLND